MHAVDYSVVIFPQILLLTKELKTSRGHFLPRSCIYIMDLPALRTVPFVQGNGLARSTGQTSGHRRLNFMAPLQAMLRIV